MATPTDRGYAVVLDNNDGTTTVMVCTALKNGSPVGTYARHVGVPTVHIDQGVAFRHTAAHRYTTEIVEVFGDNHGVHIQQPKAGLLLDN